MAVVVGVQGSDPSLPCPQLHSWGSFITNYDSIPRGCPPKAASLMKTFLEVSFLTDGVFSKCPIAFPPFDVNTYNTQLPTFLDAEGSKETSN